MRKLSTCILILLLCSVWVAIGNIGIVKADGTIYIRADGSVEGTDKIQREGNIFTLTGNIVNQSMMVEKDNTIVDGAGYALEGGHIWLENRLNVTIKNMQIIDSDEGIRLMGNCINNTIIGNNITGIESTTGNAIWVTFGASNNTISGNNIVGNRVGIYVYMSGGTIISENNITSNSMGIWLSGSRNRIIRNNIVNNGVGVSDFIGGNFVQHNNFVNNSATVNELLSVNNIWDDGYPSGGNYWSNYNGTDNNGDGMGDTPYIIDENNQDNFPLMEPTIIPEFPSWTILPLFITATFIGILVRKRLKSYNLLR